MNIAWRCPLAPTTCVWKVIESSTMGWNPGYEPYRGNISSTGIRECPVPNRCTSPPAAMASAHTRLARSMPSACVSSRRSRRSRAAWRKRPGEAAVTAAPPAGRGM